MCSAKYDEMARCYDGVLLIKAVYCRGSGLELLSALLSLAVCHDSKVKRHRNFPSKPLPRQYTALIRKTLS